MKESLWMYFFSILGIVGLVLINVFGQVIVSNEQNYYLLKEVTEAAMYDSIDLTALRNGVGYDGVTMHTDKESMHCMAYIPGTVRIIREKFVESFMRRFAESVELNRNYRVIIHDIDECPPRVSISLIATNSFSFVNFFKINNVNDSVTEESDIVNSITAILENVTYDNGTVTSYDVTVVDDTP